MDTFINQAKERQNYDERTARSWFAAWKAPFAAYSGDGAKPGLLFRAIKKMRGNAQNEQ
jgi:hypothetical protein